ncbi:MAG TPA: hypothetical protein VGM10_03785 [Actinocrinis sp.]|jgi:hypothetical protein
MTAGDRIGGMDAEETARRALAWAAADAAGPPPSGPLRDPGSLARPTLEALSALGDLVRDTGARLGAGRPPLGDRGAAGPGALFLAAAAGGWNDRPATAKRLAELIDPPGLADAAPAEGAWLDALARHAVVEPWLRVPGAPAAETLLSASPLTAVLHRPAAGGERTAGTARQTAVAVAMLARPRGAEVLRSALARWHADPAVLAWRTDVLARIAQADRAEQPFVADVYVTALLRHRADWDQRRREAARALAGRGQPGELAIRTVAYWAPLADLKRREPELVRARRVLTEAEDWLTLVRRYRLDVRGGGR